MNTPAFVGTLLIVLPIVFNSAFVALRRTFDYPGILRRPTDEVLARFRAGGTRLVLTWWVLAMTAVAAVPVAVLLSIALVGASGTVRIVAAAVGILAALLQFVGLIRWPFLVPYLARVAAEPELSPARREAVDIVFQSFNRYLGVAVTQQLGSLFTGAWGALIGVAVTQSTVAPDWVGIVGIVVGLLLVVCSLEFFGPFERDGWKFAGMLTPITHIVWSVWLAILGIVLLT